MTAKRFRFHPAAEAELNEAADWYEEQRPGLGIQFVGAIRWKIGTLLAAPDRWSPPEIEQPEPTFVHRAGGVFIQAAPLAPT